MKNKNKFTIFFYSIIFLFFCFSQTSQAATYTCVCKDSYVYTYDSMDSCSNKCVEQCRSRGSSVEQNCRILEEVWYICRCESGNYSSYSDKNVCINTCRAYCTARGIDSQPTDNTCQVGAEDDSGHNLPYKCTCNNGRYQTFRQADTCLDTCQVYCEARGSSMKSGSCTGSDSGASSSNYLCSGTGEVCNPLEEIFDVSTAVGKVIRGLLGIVGSLALAMFVYAGIIWMTARDNKEQAQKAIKIMLWTALGLILIFSSYIILKFVLNSIT